MVSGNGLQGRPLFPEMGHDARQNHGDCEKDPEEVPERAGEKDGRIAVPQEESSQEVLFRQGTEDDPKKHRMGGIPRPLEI